MSSFQTPMPAAAMSNTAHNLQQRNEGAVPQSEGPRSNNNLQAASIPHQTSTYGSAIPTSTSQYDRNGLGSYRSSKVFGIPLVELIERSHTTIPPIVVSQLVSGKPRFKLIYIVSMHHCRRNLWN